MQYVSNGPQWQGIAVEYSLADAAKAAKVNKSTMFRAIKSGKLSGRRLEDGSYRIDASELARVYDLQHLTRSNADVLQQDAPAGEGAATAATSTASETELAVLRVKLQATEEALQREREERERERGTIRLIESQLGRERDELLKRLEDERREAQRRLEEERQERREAQQKLMERPPEAAAVVEDLRKRLEEAETRIASLPAQEKLQETPTSVPMVAKPPKRPKDLLARFLGRG